VIAGLLVGAIGCYQERPYQSCIEEVTIDPAGADTVWVIDSVRLPVTATDANQLGSDLDCDSQHWPDNAFGQILGTVFGLWTDDANGDLAALIADGRLLHLLDIQAVSLADAEGAGVTLLHGVDLDGNPLDNFSGDESFGIDAGRGRGTVAGRIVKHHLEARGGQLPVGFTLPSLDEVIVLPVEGSFIELDIGQDGAVNGRLGGGIPREAIDIILMPLFADALNRLIATDCSYVPGADPCGCSDGGQGRTLLDLFDEVPEGGDCVLDVDELRNNSLITSLIFPDLDLFDADGNLAPRRDGIKDSLSIGVGFTAVPARLAPTAAEPPAHSS